jgi:LytS/YehU family sensor histidine kinase
VPLGEELAFVERYLALERMRFGDRLDVVLSVDPAVVTHLVPAFALQTLVENAVRHGAAPRVEPTRITIAARRAGDQLTVEVSDTGAGVERSAIDATNGTGLRRLRDRLDALYGARASLAVESRESAGFRATVMVPVADQDAR